MVMATRGWWVGGKPDYSSRRIYIFFCSYRFVPLESKSHSVRRKTKIINPFRIWLSAKNSRAPGCRRRDDAFGFQPLLIFFPYADILLFQDFLRIPQVIPSVSNCLLPNKRYRLLPSEHAAVHGSSARQSAQGRTSYGGGGGGGSSRYSTVKYEKTGEKKNVFVFEQEGRTENILYYCNPTATTTTTTQTSYNDNNNNNMQPGRAAAAVDYLWRLLSEFIDRPACAAQYSRTGRVRLEGDTVSSTRGRSVLKVKFKEVL